MALPKIDTPVYELDLPLSKKHIRFRPFLVKEQKNLMMAMEADDRDTIERNITQVLNNCTLTDIDIQTLPVTDIEYYFLNLRARSVSEIVENKYICTNDVNGTGEQCGNKMEVKFNLLDIKVDVPESNDEIQIDDKITIKLKYPEYSIVKKLMNKDSAVDIAFEIIAESIDYIFDGQQFYYAKDSSREELVQFIETLNTEQFGKLESFFDNLPKLNKKIEMKCSKCGFVHTIDMEGLESFFG